MAETLVLYYSATNTTKKIAEQVAQKLNADIVEIHPAQPYTLLTLIGMMKAVGQRLNNTSIIVVLTLRMIYQILLTTIILLLVIQFGGQFHRG